MAVTVKIEDRNKSSAAPVPELSDYAVPGERGEGTKSFLIWFILMLVLSAVPVVLDPIIGIGIFAWWVLASFAYFIIAPRMVLRRLRLHGTEFLITSKKHPRVKTLLSKGSAMIGVPEPEGFLTNETVSRVHVIGGQPFIVVTRGAADLLLPPELDCLALRCLVHIRLNHVRRLTLLQFLGDTPPAVRILAWPVVLYGSLLRLNWQDMAEQSADRLTLLLVKNPKLLMSSILKQFASCDPAMQAQGITIEDVDKYIKQGGLIGNSGVEISTQYKIGSAIQDNPFLDTRMHALTAWVNSPEYVGALEKMAARNNKTTGATNTATS
ncbi:MAG TPA: hypothetical protein VF600_12930 [Abditibacteriaceae bacterium]|jgi:hypothetical protein